MSAPETAAETHAILRAKSGLDINQLAAEYRALRASVLRLWMDACQSETPNQDDIIRFNEAIDQAVAESISFFSAEVEQARNLLLGMLGHDMRSPLNTIQTTASYLSALNAGDEVSAAASRLIRSGLSMKSLLDDLVDFNRTKLGLGIHISPADSDLAALFADELEQLRGAHPTLPARVESGGRQPGPLGRPAPATGAPQPRHKRDQYGASGAPVRVALTGEEADVRFEVANRGPAIEQSALDQIFDPLERGPAERDDRHDGGLGLGLYIVREVTRAHGGQVSVRSSGGETVFAVRLPRHYECAPN